MAIADTSAFRKALGAFATGVTIVTTRGAGGEDVGLTANSFSSVSLDPPLVLWSLARKSGSFDTFAVAEHWAVHVLSAGQEALSSRFSARSMDRFAGLEVARSADGAPLIAGCSAVFQCRTTFRYDGGDHVIFVGEVQCFDHYDRPPLVFHAGAYAVAAQLAEASPELHADLSYLLMRAFYLIRGPVNSRAAAHGLSLEQYYILSALMGGDCSFSDTCALLAHTGVQVSEDFVDKLAAIGFVDASQAPAALRLTPAGRALMVELVSVGKARELEVAARLPEQEKRLLARLLAALGASPLDGEKASQTALWRAAGR